MLRICFLIVLVFPALALAADRIEGQVNVIDADTWDVGIVRVRLHGIDAPELKQNCRDERGASWSCGAWATRLVRQQFQGKSARCVPLDRDRYGRIVARCVVEDLDAAEQIVLSGLAFAYRDYSDAYVVAEKKASSRRLGLHASQIQLPWVYRAAGAAQRCWIKGNISSSGEKIFHVPGQRAYSGTRINTKGGERWFCTSTEARIAGWRDAKR